MQPAIPASFSPRRILVCQLRQLGDVLLTTPALELLRHRFPAAELHLFTEKKCVPLLAHNPHLDRVWAVDKKALSSLPREVTWYWQVARQGFDLVVDFQQLPRCRWVVAFSGATVRLSYTPPWYTRPLYTHVADPVPGYAAATKASILAPLGIRWDGEAPRIYLTDEERAEAAAHLARLGLAPGQRLITLDPTHRRLTRRWPVEHYAQLVDLLAEADPGLRFLPLWGPGEEDDIRTLTSLCHATDALLLPQHMLSLRGMAAVIERASLHVGNCSAPRHMAVAVGTPSCVIHGSTGDEWGYPSPEHVIVRAHLSCQPCERNTCPRIDDPCACLTRLAPAVVCTKVREMLGMLCCD